MLFSEKLVFMMKLTSTSNKQLAEAINVDPSLISLFRTGRRNMPKNHIHMKSMASYFAKKSEGNYQRAALAEAMGRKYLPLQVETNQLASIIFDWFSDKRDQIPDFLATVERFEFNDTQVASAVPPEVKNLGNKGFAYYGNEGRRAAFDDFFEYVLSTGKKGMIYFTSDESLEWLFEEPNYFLKLRRRVVAALNNGFSLCRIAAPIRTLENAIEAFTSFLPLYLTGQMESFYYPKLRDDLYHRTLLIFPEVASIVSTSIGVQHSVGATILTHENRFSASLEAEFKAYLSLCRPMMTAYSSVQDMDGLLQSMSQFASDKGDRIQQSASLSYITMPPELLDRLIETLSPQHREAALEMHRKVCALFRTSLEEHETIDIHSVSTAEEVRAGAVPITSPFFDNEKPAFHTPETYILHLRSILYYMEHFKNYRAVLIKRTADSHSLMVKNGRRMVLPCPGKPTKTFEITQPYIAEACRAYLMQICNFNQSPAMQQLDTVSRIRELIRQLGGSV